MPVSHAVTTFRAGETVSVEFDETIYHPGYFRISIANKFAADATTADFPDPALTDLENCHFDWSKVQTVPHGNVLADGLFKAQGEIGDNRKLRQEVNLPDQPCDECTLQIVQVMEGHPAASCFYFHCTDIKILPNENAPSAAGAKSAAGAPSAAGTGGSPMAGSPMAAAAPSSDDGGGLFSCVTWRAPV